ncbi:MAG: GatB/YqeY domain-containing protein [Porphyromonadaceae bacterium]|jgi:uncharacterized protein YqeY|nr:GatB/YqeY domain-containing protein [Porphyromonadaceae bacterium]
MEKLFEQINNDIKAAMLAREKVALETLRSIKKEFLEAKTAKGSDGTLHDEQAVRIMQKMVKQRKETAMIYTEQQRPELAEKELAEAEVIERYLPRQMSVTELEAALVELISEIGAAGIQDLGKVMGAATKKLAGKADGRAISEKAKELLNKS